jgi:hypothetical protein
MVNLIVFGALSFGLCMKEAKQYSVNTITGNTWLRFTENSISIELDKLLLIKASSLTSSKLIFSEETPQK